MFPQLELFRHFSLEAQTCSYFWFLFEANSGQTRTIYSVGGIPGTNFGESENKYMGITHL